MESNHKTNTYKIFMAVIITATITFMLTTIGIYNFFTHTKLGGLNLLVKYLPTTEKTENLRAKIDILKKYLENNYIGELDEDSMSEYAMKGYVAGLKDEYTEYLTKEEYEELMINVTGNYIGIGVLLTSNNKGEVVILMPLEDSPAEEAGLKTGDIINTIDGETCTGKNLELITTRIKGEPGTKVKLEILRNNETKTLEIERKKIELKYIDSKVLEGDIGYIKLLSFDEGSAQKFREHFNNLMDKKIKSLIIDLRNNGGGIVDEVIEISELFVPRESIIMKSYDKGNNETVVKSSNSKPTKLNLVVLVNENSASATEIFTATIKDNKLGKIVGKTTFGKGVMQEVIPFTTGGALKITIKEFKTPNGDVINKKGITPDVKVEKLADDKEDIQLKKAIELLK